MNVAIAVLIYQNQFLICERKNKFEGYFEFPGGKIEKNESGEEAIKRELLEELNLSISQLKYFKSYQNIIQDVIYNLEVYYVFIDTDQITSNVHKSIHFIYAHELFRFKTFNNVNLIINDLKKEKIIL